MRLLVALVWHYFWGNGAIGFVKFAEGVEYRIRYLQCPVLGAASHSVNA